MPSPALQVEQLGKQYPYHRYTGDLRQTISQWFKQSKGSDESFWALKEVNFALSQGETLGIIGRNGSGKSTLLKILSQITKPTTGRVSLYGRVASLLEVGTGFHPDLTGRENIYLNGSFLGMTRKEISLKLDEIIDFAGIAPFIETPVKHYSSGMYMRLAFAVAAHLEAEILLVDEVLAVGDLSFQQKCLGKMNDLTQDGRTVLFVSHDLGAVNTLCKEAIWLDRGCIQQRGLAVEVIQAYSSHFEEFRSTSEYQNREGSGKLRLSQIRVLDAEDREVTSVQTGDSIRIKMEFESVPPQSFKEVVIGLPIRTASGVFMTVLNNKMSGFPIQDAAVNEVICSIDRIPLLPGTYFIDLNLIVDYQISDRIPSLIQLTVLSGDYYDSGFLNHDQRQGIYIEQTWK